MTCKKDKTTTQLYHLEPRENLRVRYVLNAHGAVSCLHLSVAYKGIAIACKRNP